MLKIRMQRTGRINSPSYRIVVIEHARSTKAGKFAEQVGTYDPKNKKRVLDAERIKYWLSVGAQPSGTMHNMLISAGIISGKKLNVLPQKSPPKREGEEAAAAAPVAAPAAEAPAEEAAKETETVEEAAPTEASA